MSYDRTRFNTKWLVKVTYSFKGKSRTEVEYISYATKPEEIAPFLRYRIPLGAQVEYAEYIDQGDPLA